MPPNQRANRYDHTPRKVFDKAIDRMELKRQRDREDNRNDLQSMIRDIRHLHQLILALTQNHTDLEQHVLSHCNVLEGREEDTEELE